MTAPSYVRVAVPVADLRGEPAEAHALNVHDQLQESQLLFHEVLLVLEEHAGWLRVEALEQQKYGPGGWQGYPGWVRKKDVIESEGSRAFDGVVKTAFTLLRSAPSATARPLFPLSLGTRLSLAKETKGFLEVVMDGRTVGWTSKKDISRNDGPSSGPERGRAVVKIARLFLGSGYLWGGRSMPMPWTRGPLLGVDCSGFVNLSFRALHLDLPRNALDQQKIARPLSPCDLGAGDLIFVASGGDESSIDHVMLSLGGEQFIEAPQTGDIVRIRSFSRQFGLPLSTLEQADCAVQGKHLYFGRIE